MSNRTISKEEWKKATELRQQGLSYDKIAEQTGIHRNTILRRFKNGGFEQTCQEFNLDPDAVSMIWRKDKEFSALLRPEVKAQKEIILELTEQMKDYAPKYPKIEHKKSKNGHLLVIDIADIHIGKYSNKDECSGLYNIPLAVERATEAFNRVLAQGQGFNIDQILLTIGNDILHVDNDHSTTTSGTNQTTDGTLREAFKAAQSMYISMIETLIPISNVHIMHNASNHDFFAGWSLAQVLQAWFKDAKNVTFDVNGQHRKYFKYGKSLIGSTHGDGAKEADLLPLMTRENPAVSLEECPFRYVYCHHMHHKIAKDYINGTVEYVRSTSTDDPWHSRNGYLSIPAGEGFIHSKDRGQISRITQNV